jgi:DNA invertase Pin-like site-specific DNA recombinase
MDEHAAARQREEAGALVRMHIADGWVLVEPAYEDVGASGHEADRPALARLLAHAEAGRVDVVVAADVARFGRSARLVAEILECLAACRVLVAFAEAGGDGAASLQAPDPLRNGLAVHAP